jgi:Glyoxalase-like domain
MKLDHIVIGTRDLNEGARYLESCLRCTLAAGGQHVGFGTHNRLLNLGDGAYLELIALDPAQVNNPAMPIQYTAPFGLGKAEVQEKIANAPQLLAWVVATDNLAQYQSLFEHIGMPTTMRRGDMQWTITHRSDGQPVPSSLPTLIDWGNLTAEGAMHPSQRLPASPVSLEHLRTEIDNDYLAIFAPLFKRDRRVDPAIISNQSTPHSTKGLQARLKIGEGEYFEI